MEENKIAQAEAIFGTPEERAQLPLDKPPFDPTVNTATGEIIEPASKAVAKPKTQAVQNPGDQAKARFLNLLNQRNKSLQNFLGNEQNALRFMSSVMQSISMNPALLLCEANSLLGAFMECASLGLYPSNFSGDCWVIPYAGKAQFQIGYRGLKTLAYRGGLTRVGTEVVYEKDKFSEELGTSQKLIHVPFSGGDRGKAIGAYAWAETLPGVVVFKFMTEDQIMKIKALSKAAKSQSSPWNTNDPMLWMWQKTAWKQLAKMLPTSEKTAKLDKAIYLDNVSERGGYIKSESEIIETPFLETSQIEKIDEGKAKKEALRNKKK